LKHLQVRQHHWIVASLIDPYAIYTQFMRWKGREESSKIEDRRGKGGGVAVGGGAALLIALLVLVFGGNPAEVLNQVATQSPYSSRLDPAREEELRSFTAVVLKDTEDVWQDAFSKQGKRYEEPTLVLFTGSVESACGNATAAVGPFYCGADQKVYIDLSFYDELKDRFGAKGDFAQAYVIAHEVGHHVQNLLGTMSKMNERRGRVSEREANALSVRLELQADYYAGMFARRAQNMKGILDRGDIESAVSAATAIGDDTLQRNSGGAVVPDSFTHGTSEQRVRWFLKGWDNGEISGGDTFNISRL
jgi:predicted metalloprotease